MSNVLVISGHPNLDSSYTNKVILRELEDRITNIETRYLDALYPDYNIDIDAEQKALINADIVILQFPFYWYSVPALLKKWIDDVFSYGFAFGSDGDNLKDKELILSFTVGGAEESYDPLGYNHFTIAQFLTPLQQTAYLAGMIYHKPIYTHSMVFIPEVYNTQEQVETRALEHADKLVTKINALSNSDESVIKKFVTNWYQQFDHLKEDNSFFLNHLNPSTVIQLPDQRFEGKTGFNQWYQTLRSEFKPGGDHRIEQLSVSHDGDTHNVNVRVRYISETIKDEAVDLLANLKWKVKVDEQKHVTIEHYKVELAA